MSGLLIVAVLCCAFTTGFTDKIPVKDCGSQLATIHGVDINPCPELPCQFKKNTTVTVTITFTPNTTIENATVAVFGNLFMKFFVPYNLEDTNACDGMRCPCKPGELVTYITEIPVYSNWPDIERLIVKWTLIMNDTDILCFTVPVAITG